MSILRVINETTGEWEDIPAIKGDKGDKGDAGDTGATGADGKSAYAYAVDGGYTGTEAEFAAEQAAEKYQVGDIFISTVSTSPASRFGGTWEQITDKFLLAAGSSFTAGSTGGANTVTLTTEQMPSHRHAGYAQFSGGAETAAKWTTYIKSDAWGQVTTTGGESGFSLVNWDNGEGVGGGEAFDIMPPYLAVYVWKRVA